MHTLDLRCSTATITPAVHLPGLLRAASLVCPSPCCVAWLIPLVRVPGGVHHRRAHRGGQVNEVQRRDSNGGEQSTSGGLAGPSRRRRHAAAHPRGPHNTGPPVTARHTGTPPHTFAQTRRRREKKGSGAALSTDTRTEAERKTKRVNSCAPPSRHAEGERGWGRERENPPAPLKANTRA